MSALAVVAAIFPALENKRTCCGADACQFNDAEPENDCFLVLDGPDFRRTVLDANGNIRQSAFDAVWQRLRVLARCSPADKFTIVKGACASMR